MTTFFQAPDGTLRPVARGASSDSTAARLPAETSLNCPRCGLVVALTPHWLALKHCPRCVASACALVEMVRSDPVT
jgi:hypothetical protein